METWRKRFKRTVLAGLLILVPLALTVFVLRQLFQLLDGIFAPLVDRVLAIALDKPDLHVPGLGLLLTAVVVLLLGWLSRSRLIHSMEQVIQRIPVAKSIYGGTKGILEVVAKDQTEAFKRVVLIEYPKKDIFAIAFVTAGARWGELDDRMEDLLMVFLPTTPNPTSGFLLLVPRAETIELPITVEEGVRMVISGGILLPQPRVPERAAAPVPGQPVRLRPLQRPAEASVPAAVPAAANDVPGGG
jgi:uncharacterized membrane protein